MKEQLYEFIGNKNKSLVFRTTIFIVIFLIILDQIYSLTKFVLQYMQLFDYGRMLKKTCNNAYTEYETERFHVFNNIVNLKLKNDNTNDRYNTLIYIISFICALYVAYFFVFLCIETSFDNILTTKMNEKISSNIQNILNYFKINISQISSGYSVFKIIVILIKVLLITYLIIIIPLFVILKVNNNVDISPFVNDWKNILSHSLILSMIFLLQLFSKVSYFTFTIFFNLFVVVFFIIYLMTNIYIQEKKNAKNNHPFENSDNYNLKYSSFIKSYFNDVSKNNSNIISNFIQNILGFNDVNIKLEPVADVKDVSVLDFIDTKTNNFKNVVFIILILLLSLLFIYIILCFKPDGFELYGIFQRESLDKDLIYNFGFIPILLFFIGLMVLIVTKEWNTMVNKNIFYNPNNVYRRQILKINSIFNEILENDKATVSNDSICKNISNAIHLTLYSCLFSGYQNIFIPELQYTFKCIDNQYIDYSNMKEYNIEYYIDKIFYNDLKCSSVNNELLIILMTNTIPKYNGKIMTDDDLVQYKKNFTDKLKFSINNIMKNKNYIGTRKLELTNDYINNNQIFEINPSIPTEQSIDQDTIDLIDFVGDEFLKFIDVMYKYNIQTIQALCKCNKISDITLDGYEQFMKKIETTLNDKSNGEYSLNIKKYYIKQFTILSKILFQKINTQLTSNIKISDKNRKLSKYIINNFNFYQKNKSDVFKKQSFNVLNTKSIIANDIVQFIDIKDCVKTIETIKDLFQKIHDTIIKNLANINDQIAQNIVLIEENLALLRQQRNEFSNLFKDKYYYDNDYNKQLIFDYKIELIDSFIKLNEETVHEINNVTLKKIIENIKFDTETLKNTIKGNSEKKSKFNNFDMDKYSQEYQKYFDTYNSKYNLLNKLQNDMFKNDFDKSFQDLEVENIYKQLKKNSDDTSRSIYLLFIIYIILIIVANIIK